MAESSVKYTKLVGFLRIVAATPFILVLYGGALLFVYINYSLSSIAGKLVIEVYKISSTYQQGLQGLAIASSLGLILYPLLRIYYKNNDGVLDEEERRNLKLYWIPAILYYGFLITAFGFAAKSKNISITVIEVIIQALQLCSAIFFDYLAGLSLSPSIFIIFPELEQKKLDKTSGGDKDHEWGLSHDSNYKWMIDNIKKASATDLAGKTDAELQSMLDKMNDSSFKPASSASQTFKNMFGKVRGECTSTLKTYKARAANPNP